MKTTVKITLSTISQERYTAYDADYDHDEQDFFKFREKLCGGLSTRRCIKNVVINKISWQVNVIPH